MISLSYGGSKRGGECFFITVHAFSFTIASTLMVEGFCHSTVYLRSWGRQYII
jgi:hypothetical protein